MRSALPAALIVCAAAHATATAMQGPATSPAPAVLLQDRSGRSVSLAAGQRATVGQNGLGELSQVTIPKGHRATFCESADARAACRRLVGVIEGPPAALTPPFRAAGTAVS